MGFTIRPATASDSAEVVRVIRAVHMDLIAGRRDEPCCLRLILDHRHAEHISVERAHFGESLAPHADEGEAENRHAIIFVDSRGSR